MVVLITCASVADCSHLPIRFNPRLPSKPTQSCSQRSETEGARTPESTISEIRGRLQPCPDRRLKLPDFARCLASFALAEIPRANFLGFAVERPPQDFQRSAATDFSDENLEAKTPGGVGRVKEERKPLNRSILDAPDAVIQSDSVSSRCHGDGSNDSSRSAW